MTLLPDSLKAHIQYLIAMMHWKSWQINLKIDFTKWHLEFCSFPKYLHQATTVKLVNVILENQLKSETRGFLYERYRHSKCQISRCTHVSLDYLSRLMNPDQSAKKGSWVKKSHRSCFRVSVKRHFSFSLMLSNWIGIVRGGAKRTTVYFYLVCNRIWSPRCA